MYWHTYTIHTHIDTYIENAADKDADSDSDSCFCLRQLFKRHIQTDRRRQYSTACTYIHTVKHANTHTYYTRIYTYIHTDGNTSDKDRDGQTDESSWLHKRLHLLQEQLVKVLRAVHGLETKDTTTLERMEASWLARARDIQVCMTVQDTTVDLCIYTCKAVSA
jgi:hypothetical protein